MGKLKFTLSNILYWLAVVASCLLLENVAFLSTTNGHDTLHNTLFFMLFTLATLGYIAYYIIEHKKNHAHLDYLLFAICTFVLIVAAISIWSFPSLHSVSADGTRTFDYSLNRWDQVTQTLSLFIFILTVYTTLFFFNKNYPSIRKICVIFVIICLVCYFAGIYSLIFEMDAIVYRLNNPNASTVLESIFWNTNMFCGMMLMGILSCIGLNYYKKNVFSYASIIFFEFMLLIGASIAASIISIAVIALYFLIEIIFTIFKKRTKGIVLLAVYLFVAVGVTILFAASLKYNLGGLSNFFRAIHSAITSGNYSNFSDRTFTWNNIVMTSISHPLNFLFGFGFRNSNYIIGSFWYLHGDDVVTLSAHSGYMQILMNFGLVGVLVYASFLVYYFYCFIRLSRRVPRFAALYLLIGFAMLVYGTMESVLFFIPNTQGILVGLAFFLPMINRWKHIRHSELGDDTLVVEKPNILKPRLISQSLAKIFVGLAACLVPLFAFDMFREHVFFKYLVLNIIVVLVLCAFTIPYIVSCLSIKKTRKHFLLVTAANFLLLASIFGFLIVRYYFKDALLMENSKWVYVILLAITLVAECIIFSIGKRQSFKDYSYTLLGMSKNSFMGLIGVGIVACTAYFIRDRIDIYTNPLVLILLVVISLLIYFLFSYLVPFKDQTEIIYHYNSLGIYSLKMDVVKDRLGAMNENLRD